MSPFIINPFLGGSGGGGGALSSPATITIDHTKAGSADTSNFVMLFSTTDAAFKSVANGGSLGNVNDFRFTDSGGVTLLTWEIIKWVATTGELVANVNIGTLSHTVDTVIKLLFDGTSRGSFLGGSVGAAYDTGYQVVTIGGDGTTLDLTDHTSHARNGTNVNSVLAASGPSGLGAMAFTFAANKSVTVSGMPASIPNPTVEAWVFLASLPGGGTSMTIVSFAETPGSGTTDKDIWVDSTGNIHWYIFDGAQKFLVSTGTLSTGAWHHVVGTADGTTQRLYIDGVQDTSQLAGNAYTGYSTPGMGISGVTAISVNPQPLDGSVSTVRFSNIVRPLSYILATYNSIISPSTFYGIA